MESRLDDQASAASGLTSAKSVSGAGATLGKKRLQGERLWRRQHEPRYGSGSRGTRNNIDAKPE